MSAAGLPSKTINVARLPRTGRSIRLAARPAELAAIAAHAGVESVSRLEVELEVAPYARSGAVVSGRVRADYRQPCVVTTDLLDLAVDIPIKTHFVGAEAATPAERIAEGELVLDAEAEDPPERLEGQALDLWEVVGEALVLAVELFPRAPGAVLDPAHSESCSDPDEAATRSPFAALGKLRGDRGASG